MVDVKMPNGDVVSFPDDMPKEQIRGFIEQKFPQETMQPTAFREEPYPSEQIGGFARGMVDTLTYGGFDEMQAAAASALGLSPYEYQLQKSRKQLEQLPQGPVMAGQVAGAFTPAMGTGGAIARFAQQSPRAALGAATGLGAAQGGLYGFLSGEGGVEPRVESGTYGGIAGGVGGAGAYGVLRGVGSLAQRGSRSLTERARQVLEKTTGKEPKPLSTLSKDGALSLPTGAATNDVNMMRAEEAARQGLLGDEYQAMINQVDENVVNQATDIVRGLAGKEGASQDLLESGIDIVKRRAKAEKRAMGALMQTRDDKLARAQVYRDYTADTLGNGVKELLDTPEFRVKLPKEAAKPIKEDIQILTNILNKEGDAIDFVDLQAWRSNLNSYKAGTEEGIMAGSLKKTYDEWLDGIYKTAFKTGDEDTVDKLFEANRKYAEFKGRYGTNKYKGQNNLIESIVTKDELTPDHLVNMTFGKTLKGTNNTTQAVKRMVNAMPEGEKRNRLIGDLKAGLVMRAFENSQDAGGNVSVGKLISSLKTLKENRAYKDFLSNEAEQKTLDTLLMDLTKYQDAISRRDVYSPSGPAVLRGLEGLLNMVGGVTSPLGGRAVTEPIKAAVQQGKLGPDRTLVERSLKEFSNNLISAGRGTYAYYGSKAGRATAAAEQNIREQ